MISRNFQGHNYNTKIIICISQLKACGSFASIINGKQWTGSWCHQSIFSTSWRSSRMRYLFNFSNPSKFDFVPDLRMGYTSLFQIRRYVFLVKSIVLLFFFKKSFSQILIFDISGEPRLVFPNATAGGHPRVGQFASPFHPNVASTPAGNNEISISRKIYIKMF